MGLCVHIMCLWYVCLCTVMYIPIMGLGANCVNSHYVFVVCLYMCMVSYIDILSIVYIHIHTSCTDIVVCTIHRLYRP